MTTPTTTIRAAAHTACAHLRPGDSVQIPLPDPASSHRELAGVVNRVAWQALGPGCYRTKRAGDVVILTRIEATEF